MDDATLDALRAMTVGDALGTLPPAVQAGLGLLMVLAAGWSLLRPSVLRVVAFLAAGFVFARANQAFEGPVLWTFTHDHGLVLADLLPLGLLLAVGGRVLFARSHRAPEARAGATGGYEASHGALPVRLRHAPVASAAVPRGAPRRGPG